KLFSGPRLPRTIRSTSGGVGHDMKASLRRPWQAGHRHLTDRHEALTLGKRSTAALENGRIPVTLAGVFRSDFIERRSFMPIRTILLIVAVILFLLEALGSRMR